MGLLYKKQERGLVGSCNAPTIASPGRVTRYLLFKQNPQAMWPYWQRGPMTRFLVLLASSWAFGLQISESLLVFILCRNGKPGRAVLVLTGHYSGQRAIIMKNTGDSTADHPYIHTLPGGCN